MDAPQSGDGTALAPTTRRLVRAVVAIARADWSTLQATATEARERGDDRAQLEEALLQAALFYGFPRVVTAFEQTAEAWPSTMRDRSFAVPRDEQLARGRELFAAIYGKNDEAVRARLASFHPDFHDFVLEAAYGRILARPGLDVKTRELLAVGALAALGQIPQLVAHARGALRFGSTQAEVREAMQLSGLDATEAESALSRAAAGAQKQ